jgi:hypothetical protein
VLPDILPDELKAKIVSNFNNKPKATSEAHPVDRVAHRIANLLVEEQESGADITDTDLFFKRHYQEKLKELFETYVEKEKFKFSRVGGADDYCSKPD